MATIYKKLELALDAETLWKRVADVGGISELLDGISHSAVDGNTRSCTLANGAQLTEQIISVDQTRRRVAYTITAGPLPFTFHAASMAVEAGGEGRSALTWITDVAPDELAGPLGQMIDDECRKLEARFP